MRFELTGEEASVASYVSAEVLGAEAGVYEGAGHWTRDLPLVAITVSSQDRVRRYTANAMSKGTRVVVNEIANHVRAFEHVQVFRESRLRVERTLIADFSTAIDLSNHKFCEHAYGARKAGAARAKPSQRTPIVIPSQFRGGNTTFRDRRSVALVCSCALAEFTNGILKNAEWRRAMRISLAEASTRVTQQLQRTPSSARYCFYRPSHQRRGPRSRAGLVPTGGCRRGDHFD